MSIVADILASCEVRKRGYASRPWRIVHVPTDREISEPKALDTSHGVMRFSGPVCFSRKRDAVAWLGEAIQRQAHDDGNARIGERMREYFTDDDQTEAA
jgi:hypothetical protein